MIWNSWADFLHMGGYGLYVWGSVIVTFGLMALELVILSFRRRAILEHLGRLHAADRNEEEGDESTS